MKLISYEAGGKASFGVVKGDGIVDAGARLGGRIQDHLLADGLKRLAETAEANAADVALADIRYQRPVPWPEKIICVGVNYANRSEEYKEEAPKTSYPSMFYRAPDSLVGHREPIIRPPESDQLDYEGEIAIIVGKPGRRIPRETALDHIGALTIMNEGTIRDWLRHSRFNVTQGKNFDRTGALGPWMVTADEFSTYNGMHVQTRVNGEVRQDDTTDSIIYDFTYLLNYISTFTTLKTGDVIATGTPTGAGARFDPPIWLKPGDTVEVEVSGIGTLSNTVEDEK